MLWHRRLLAAVLCGVTFLTGATACGDEADLRRDQARQIRAACQSFAMRSKASVERVNEIGARDLDEFTLGDRGLAALAVHYLYRNCGA